MKPKKSLSQNFLINKNILKKIESEIPKLENNVILEIGAGKGAISDIIINKSPKRIIIIEKDDKLFVELKEKYDFDFIKIIHEDVLNITFECDMVIASIPYSISREIIKKIILNEISISYLIVQKEFAEKLFNDIANPISIFTKTFAKVNIIFNIDRRAFSPIPKVDSAFIKIEKRHNNKNIDKRKYWDFIVKLSSLKRKKVGSVLKNNDNRRIMHLKYFEIEDLYVNGNLYSH